jgi:hypothetical protein
VLIRIQHGKILGQVPSGDALIGQTSAVEGHFKSESMYRVGRVVYIDGKDHILAEKRVPVIQIENTYSPAQNAQIGKRISAFIETIR